MTRPPLANLFAVHDPDPTVLDEIAADVESSGEFAEVWRPAPGWVAAAAPLPGGEPHGRIAREAGLAFAEGGDFAWRGASGSPREAVQEVAELADVSPERLGSLPGEFAFIRFREGGRATVVRSCGGRVPFYLQQSRECVAVSTRLGDFVRYLRDEPRLDPLANAVWTTGQGFFPDRRTFLAGVSILDRGGFARVEPGREPGLGRYWNPRSSSLSRPTAARAREHAERLRALLVDHLARELDPDGANLLTLSGGVDSSSLGALAAGTVGRALSTVTILPAPQDLFEREMSYIEPLASRFRFERSWLIRMRPETRIELLRAAPRVVFHVVHPALCALPGIVRDAPVRVLFGGEFADEVCGSAFTLPDWAAHTSPLALLTGLGRLPLGPKDPLRWLKHRLLSLAGRPLMPHPTELPDFVRSDLREEYRAWRAWRLREAGRDPGPRPYLGLCAELDGFLAMNWEASSALGIRRAFPFFNREVLELAFECHPVELVGPGTKRLLRRALRDDVPSKNLQRADKGQWGGYLQAATVAWDTPVPETLGAVVCPEWHATRPRRLDLFRASRLEQLVIFVEALRASRLKAWPREPLAPAAASFESRDWGGVE